MATTGDVVQASSMSQPALPLQRHGESKVADEELMVPTGSIPQESTVIQMPPESADGLVEDDNAATASLQDPSVINQETDALLGDSRPEGQNQSELLSEAEIRNIIWITKGPEELKEVDGGKGHILYKVALEQWETKDKLFASRVEKKTKQSMSVRNEIYQLIGFYSVFQGVLLTAVAQSNLLHCNNWWTVFILSALASTVTVGGVIQKFSTIWALEKTIATEDIARKQVVKWLSQLRSLGPGFSFQKHAQDGKPSADKGGSSPRRNSNRLKISIIAVIVVLISFSVTFLVAIRQILCNPGHSLLPGQP